MPKLFPVANTGGGTAAAYPDVCKTPPGPVPVPYPNTGSLSDARGTPHVKIQGNQVLRLGDEIQLSTGDEAGVAGGVVSGTIKSKIKFLTAWSHVFADGKMVAYQTVVTGHNGPGVKNITTGMLVSVSVKHVWIAVNPEASTSMAVAGMTLPTVPGAPDTKSPECPSPNHQSQKLDTAPPEVKDWLNRNDKRGPAAHKGTLGEEGGGGFKEGTSRTRTIKKGTKVKRWGGGKATQNGGWWFEESTPVVDPISEGALPPGNDASEYYEGEVIEDVEVLEGEGAPRCSNKPGGPTQLCFPHPREKYIKVTKVVK
jgi:hypothetical protein